LTFDAYFQKCYWVVCSLAGAIAASVILGLLLKFSGRFLMRSNTCRDTHSYYQAVDSARHNNLLRQLALVLYPHLRRLHTFHCKSQRGIQIRDRDSH